MARADCARPYPRVVLIVGEVREAADRAEGVAHALDRPGDHPVVELRQKQGCLRKDSEKTQEILAINQAVYRIRA